MGSEASDLRAVFYPTMNTEKQVSRYWLVTSPSFCTTVSETVYINSDRPGFFVPALG
jgi:hypothetical protein